VNHSESLPGVYLDVYGVTEPGVGFLEYDGSRLRWTAPGESVAGAWVTVSGASHTLYSDDYSTHVEARITAASLPIGAASSSVYLRDSYGSLATPGDVDAEDALAGVVRSWTLTFRNGDSVSCSMKVYLGGASAGTFEVSANNSDWSSPVTEGTALSFGTINASATATIYLREIIASSTAFDPSVLLVVNAVALSSGETEWNTITARGLYRVFNDPGYRFYRSNSAPPMETDTPYATSASLPATPADTFADGTWWLSCSYFNGVLDSGFLPVGPRGETYRTITVASGVALATPPGLIQEWRLEVRPAGVVRVLGWYLESGDNRADEWSISYTVDGSSPPADTPTEDVAFVAAAGMEVIAFDLPAQVDTTVVKVLLQTRRNDGTEETPAWVYSDDATVQTVTIDLTGPTGSPVAVRWPGRIVEGM
jgi:hypothetical protein